MEALGVFRRRVDRIALCHRRDGLAGDDGHIDRRDVLLFQEQLRQSLGEDGGRAGALLGFAHCLRRHRCRQLFNYRVGRARMLTRLEDVLKSPTQNRLTMRRGTALSIALIHQRVELFFRLCRD